MRRAWPVPPTGQRAETAAPGIHEGARGVREVAPGVYMVTSDRPPRGPFMRAWRRVRRLLLGSPLPSWRERRERLGWIAALAILGADLIASSIYGPEEMLRRLAEAGPAGLHYTLPISVTIVVLLVVLAFSYWQTIGAYPNGAGGYIVASDNLGRLAGLVAAAALLVDYTLDVAVSVATGVQTITSTVPVLAPWRVLIALAALGFITVANLRGIRAAGALLSAPIYLYIFGTLAVVAYGLFRLANGSLPSYTPPSGAEEMVAQPASALGLLLLLRAFSSGAVALTGVEAISNGVPYFKPPETRNAHRTLAALALTFGALFLGISFLSGVIGIVPDPNEVETVHSQLTRTLLGQGLLYVLLQATTLLLLVLAADTGFADFPRLIAILAHDGYLPEAFAARGARLSFSNGILLVAAISAVLIVVFGASVAALVPLFTVGAFLTFTLSQAGMVRHWWRHRDRGWRWRLGVNALGAVMTTVVLGVVVVSKFAHGAWLVVAVLPVLVLALRAVGKHHERLERHVRLDSPHAVARALSVAIRHYFVIPVGVDRIALQAVAYSRSLGLKTEPRSKDGSSGDGTPPQPGYLEAVHVTDDEQRAAQFHDEWEALQTGVPLVILVSPYRATAEVLLRYLDLVQKREAPTTFVTVVLPEVLPTRWWHPFFHNYLAWRLKWALLFLPRTAVTSVPYAVRD